MDVVFLYIKLIKQTKLIDKKQHKYTAVALSSILENRWN